MPRSSSLSDAWRSPEEVVAYPEEGGEGRRKCEMRCFLTAGASSPAAGARLPVLGDARGDSEFAESLLSGGVRF